eukprot:TRINITY_DN32107_c0_g1_i1.p1 TRINITY_DN32107_c0_g1~~TRINITY_DN32107_c0_g1_i1.p1  ORF type:complete len:312 (+),score=47.59 TRINITY_DN32107_c0_g1_i1:173-1108(+)
MGVGERRFAGLDIIDDPLPQDLLCVSVYSAATGQHLAALDMRANETIGNFCKEVEETLRKHGKGVACVRAIGAGRFLDSAAELSVAARAVDGAAHVDVVKLRPDTVVTRSRDGVCKFWTVETGECILTMEDFEPREFTGRSPDGQFELAMSGANVVIREVISGHTAAVLRGHDLFVTTAAFSADGRRVITGSLDCTSRIFDWETELCLQTFRGHTKQVAAAFFSRDGRFAVTASLDGTARVWHADERQQGLMLTIDGHDWALNDVAFSSSGNMVVTASDDRLAKVWNVDTGQCIATLRGHAAPVVFAAFPA